MLSSCQRPPPPPPFFFFFFFLYRLLILVFILFHILLSSTLVNSTPPSSTLFHYLSSPRLDQDEGCCSRINGLIADCPDNMVGERRKSGRGEVQINRTSELMVGSERDEAQSWSSPAATAVCHLVWPFSLLQYNKNISHRTPAGIKVVSAFTHHPADTLTSDVHLRYSSAALDSRLWFQQV